MKDYDHWNQKLLARVIKNINIDWWEIKEKKTLYHLFYHCYI